MGLIRWKFVDAKQFDTYQAEWGKLNSAGPRTPLLDASLVRIALHHFGSGHEKLGVARRDRQIVAMALFCPKRFGALNMFQPSQLPLGPFVSRTDIPLSELTRALIASLPFRYVLSSLSQLDSLFFARPPQSARDARTLTHIQTGYIDLPATYAEYIESRPRKKRNQVAKRIEKAEADIGPVHLTVHGDAEEAAGLVGAFADMESAGWKAKAGSAITRGGDQEKFYTEVLQHFGRIGQLKIFQLHFGEKRAAMQLAVHAEGCLYLLKSSYDESLKDYSPGVALKQYLIEQLYNESTPFHRVEFYGRVIEPHRTWITGSREIFHANIYRAPVLARIHDAMRAKSAKTAKTAVASAAAH